MHVPIQVPKLVQALGLNLGEQEDPLDFSSMLFTRILYDESHDGKRSDTADHFEFKYQSITHSSFLPEEGSATDAVMTHLVLSDYTPRYISEKVYILAWNFFIRRLR